MTVTKTPCDIKNGLIEAIAEVSWVVESGDAHDLQDACDLAHESMDNAFDYIQQLETDNAQQARCIENLTDKLNATNDALPRWISVKERLPEDGKNVIVFVRSCADWWTMDIDWCVNGHWVINADDEWHNITHWMPLPTPPEV